MVKNGKTFRNATWVKFTDAQLSRTIPSGVEFARYADSKGV
jgi:predicted secreted acid phosphatase